MIVLRWRRKRKGRCWFDRVIAGRVRKNVVVVEEEEEEYDSVAGATTTGVYSNLDELYVFNPRAILPCFVVIYGGF